MHSDDHHGLNEKTSQPDFENKNESIMLYFDKKKFIGFLNIFQVCTHTYTHYEKTVYFNILASNTILIFMYNIHMCVNMYICMYTFIYLFI